jgi:hypothetical protein
VTNAYLRGEKPSVGEHEWAGAITGYILKKLSALLVPDFQTIGCICTKYSLLLSIIDQRLIHTMKDYGLVDDTQGGFRRHHDRSTKRQLGKLHSILAEQRQRKDSISVILYLDIMLFNTIKP